MSTYTTNYNLEKPDSTDDFKDFRSNYNSNMDIIDANLGGGGGGNVDDVLVNGVSVVDGNHDAQITSYKEVTQAEYDALPATKLTDGIAYFIKDAGGGGGGSSSHNYSTTEQVIGTWIDGKPLYEKVIDFGTLPSNYIKSIDTGVSNIGLVTKVDGFAYSSSATINIPYIEANSSSTKQTIDIWHNTSSNKVEVNTNFNASSFYGFIVIQYTKTTD